MDRPRNEQQVGFNLSGEAVPVRTFIAVAERLADLLKEVEVAVAGQQGLEWLISDLRTGSANLAIVPVAQTHTSADGADLIIAAVMEGLAEVEAAAQRPSHFTNEALRYAKSLANAANGDGNRLSIFGGGQAEHRQVAISQRLAAHVDEIIGPASVALGSLEGRLEALTVHDAIAFSIYDSITNRRIMCRCNRETLDLAMKHFEKRVSVSGEIRFNARGEATSMKVDEVRPLRTGPLPQAKDIRGLFSDYQIDGDEWSKFVREKW